MGCAGSGTKNAKLAVAVAAHVRYHRDVPRKEALATALRNMAPRTRAARSTVGRSRCWSAASDLREQRIERVQHELQRSGIGQSTVLDFRLNL